MKISFVIPTLNEEENIDRVLNTITQEMEKRNLKYEIIIVDGYSKDNTVKISKKYDTKILYEISGKGSALRKGFEAAKGDVIISMDADLSHNPKEIGLLTEGINAGYDICAGSRFIQGGGTEDMPWFRKLGNKFFVLLVNFFWRTNYSDMCYGYRAIKKPALKELDLIVNGFGIETEIAINAAQKKLKVLEIPSFEKKRVSGKGKLKTLKDGLEIFQIILRKLIKKQFSFLTAYQL